MFELLLHSHLCAAHQIIGHQGKCQFLHGHNWHVALTVQDQDGDKLMAHRTQIQQTLENIIAAYDHTFLNDLPEFKEINSTAEQISRILHHQCQAVLGNDITVQSVKVWETPKYAAEYSTTLH